MDNPFELLGLDPRFDLDRAELERAWLAQSALLHPDLGGRDADALARLNQARQDLADPERRAGILLSLLGGPSKEADRTLPPDFLAAMMQVQEAIESAEDPDHWRAWAENERQAIIEQVRVAFAELDDPPDPADLAAIRGRLNQWRYVERIIERLD